MKVDTDNLVGIAEIARDIGVSRQVVSNWRSRDATFPQPVKTLSMGPVFDMNDVKNWIVANDEK